MSPWNFCKQRLGFKILLVIGGIIIFGLGWQTGTYNTEMMKTSNKQQDAANQIEVQVEELMVERQQTTLDNLVSSSLKNEATPMIDTTDRTTEIQTLVTTDTNNYGSSCTPQNSIVFMKTHKTGGSSIQNMCMRYVVAHNLTIALPRFYNYFGHPKPFEKSMVKPVKNVQKFDVLAHHTRFSYKNMKDFMPTDTVFFTVLREPASLFESAYSYYYLEMQFKMSLEEFVSHNKSNPDPLNERVPSGRIGRNQMSFDLGVNVDQFENEEEIQRVAETLNQQFQLVMIRERMNESLVLLKHLLCWSTDDVVILNQNARAEKAKKKLTPELKKKILYWNNADKILYDYFWKKFDEKVNAFGVDKMKKEVEELQERTVQWQGYCTAGVAKDSSAYASNINTFKKSNVNNQTCEYLVKQEMDFTDFLRQKQNEQKS